MAGRTSAQVKDSMRGVDVLDVAVLKVVGRVGRVEAFYGRGALASLELDGDRVLQAVGPEDVLLDDWSGVAFRGRGQGDTSVCRAR